MLCNQKRRQCNAAQCQEIGLKKSKKKKKELPTHLFPICLFSTPWKHRETLQFFSRFQEVEKGCIGNKRVKEKNFCWKTFLRKIFSRLSSKRPDYCGKTFFAVETFYHFYFLSPSSSCAPHAPLPSPSPNLQKKYKINFYPYPLIKTPNL